MCELITCLGRCGLYKTLDGLRIGYLSGSSNKNDQNYAVQENANLKFKSLINPNDSTGKTGGMKSKAKIIFQWIYLYHHHGQWASRIWEILRMIQHY